MLQTSILPQAHSDLVTDAVYDYYGLRLATCSLDQRIKIWKLNDSTGDWLVEDDWKAHEGPIVKLSWAHPEYGPVLASCSFDRTVKIWEELPHEPHLNAQQSRWVERACLIEARGSVRSVEFAPPFFGLKLVSISSDSYLRMYDCLETFNIAAWSVVEELDVLAVPLPSPTLTATGTPTLTSMSLDGATPTIGAVVVNVPQPAAPPMRPGMGSKEADGGWCLSWCKEKWWGELVAVGCGSTGLLKVFKFLPSHRPNLLLSLNHVSPTPAQSQSAPTQPYAITSVSWAPTCGRSYHLVATGSRDGRVRIFKLKAPTPSAVIGSEESMWTSMVAGEFDDHKSSVGRVEWNITGTILSSAGDDGQVRLYKASSTGIWRPVGSFTVLQTELAGPDEMES